MRARTLLASAALGYLAGSISFSRLIGARVAPEEDLETTRVEDEGEQMTLMRVSPSTMGMHAGRMWGATAGILDIAKAAMPVWACRRLAPETGAAHVAGVAAVLGHAYPVFHGFRGGYGQSPIVGTLAVVDPWAIAGGVAGSSVAGVAVADAWVIQDGWPIFLIPWAMWRHDRRLLAFAVVANAVYAVTMWPDVRQHVDIVRRSGKTWRQRLRDLPDSFGEIAAE